MSLTIREFNKSDHDYQTIATLNTAVWPEHPTVPEEWKHNDEIRDPKYIVRRFFAVLDGKEVGYCDFFNLKWSYDPHRFFVMVNVHPDYRNQGIGSALYDHAIALLKDAHQAKELMSFTTENRTHAMQFADKRGFVEKMREWESRLDTTNYDYSKFDGLAEKVAARGIEIKSYSEWRDIDPDFLHKLHQLMGVLDEDVPSPVESTLPDFDEWIKSNSDAHPSFIGDAFFVARDGDTYIGVSQLEKSQANDNLYTGLTGVRREYRRKGIATAMKLDAIRYAQTLGNRMIITWNEQNNPMYQINVQLGFVAQPAEINYMKEL